MSRYLTEKYYWHPKERVISGFLIYLMITVSVYLLPYTKAVAPYIPVALLMLSFLPFAMIKQVKWFNYGLGVAAGAVVIGIFNLLHGQHNLVDLINELVRSLRFFLPVLWFAYFARYGNQKQRNIFLVFFACVCVFILINTMIALEENPMIARTLAQGKGSDNAQIRAYRLNNVAGFEFAYMSGVLTLCFAWLAQQSKKTWQKVCFILAAVVLFYYIVQTMYTTLLLLTSIGILILMFVNTKHTAARVALIVGFMVLLTVAESLFGWLAKVFSEFPMLAEKMKWFQNAFQGEGVDALGSRPQKIWNALETWIKNPIWGSKAKDTHSTVFALLAGNGLIGITVWVLMMHFGYRIVIANLHRMGAPVWMFRIAYAYLVVLSVLNPTDYVFELPIVVFFVAPLISTFFASKVDGTEQLT